jgi:hypothetical protein
LKPRQIAPAFFDGTSKEIAGAGRVERAALTKEWVIDKLRENLRFGCPGSPRTAKVPPLPVPMKPLVLHYRGRFSPATNSPNF